MLLVFQFLLFLNPFHLMNFDSFYLEQGHLSVDYEVNLRVILLPAVLLQFFAVFHAVLQLPESPAHEQSLKDFLDTCSCFSASLTL